MLLSFLTASKGYQLTKIQNKDERIKAEQLLTNLNLIQSHSYTDLEAIYEKAFKYHKMGILMLISHIVLILLFIFYIPLSLKNGFDSSTGMMLTIIIFIIAIIILVSNIIIARSKSSIYRLNNYDKLYPSITMFFSMVLILIFMIIFGSAMKDTINELIRSIYMQGAIQWLIISIFLFGFYLYFKYKATYTSKESLQLTYDEDIKMFIINYINKNGTPIILLVSKLNK